MQNLIKHTFSIICLQNHIEYGIILNLSTWSIFEITFDREFYSYKNYTIRVFLTFSSKKSIEAPAVFDTQNDNIFAKMKKPKSEFRDWNL